jgi:Tfp pilus assembly protein PilN
MASPNQLSFLPDDYLERKAQRRTNVICAGLFLVVMVAIGGAFTFTERSTRDVDKRHDEKLKEFTAEARRIQQAEKMQEKQRTMARQAELAASLLEKVPRSFMLAEFTNALPPGVSLVDFNMEAKVKRPAGAPGAGGTAFQQKQAARKAAKSAPDQSTTANQQPASDAKAFDVSMKLTGLAQTDVQVAQFIRKLNESKLLKDVNLVISDEYVKEGETLRKFQIECMLDPTAEVQPNEGNKTLAVELKSAVAK